MSADAPVRCLDGSLTHDFKGQRMCPACGWAGVTMGTDAARSFTLTDIGLRALTTNAERKGNRFAVAKHIAATRMRWGWIAKAAKVPHLERVAVTVTPLYSSARSLSDPGGVSPEAKAAVDGLRDAGVLTDDTGVHVASITYLAPVVTNVDGMRLTITEVPA